MSTNVLADIFWMTGSFSHTSSSCSKIYKNTIGVEEQNRLQLILGIVVCSIGVAIFLAPERPQQFASICEKYNTTNACQVW